MTEANLPAAIQKKLDLEKRKDDLAKKVYGVVSNASGNIPQTAQLQNLRTLAAGTESREELIIFIKYQMSRGGNLIPDRFGEAILQAMPERMDEARLFFGYLYRYASKIRKDDERRKKAQQEAARSGQPGRQPNRGGGRR